MNQNENNKSQHGHLFTVQVLIEESTNGLALEKLLHVLNANANTIKDYKILQGMELGKLIELNVNKKGSPTKEVQKKPAPPVEASAISKNITAQLKEFITNNTLIRLFVVKAKGIRLNLPCRILSYDSSNESITVYHVDEKQVYIFKLYEIEDYTTT